MAETGNFPINSKNKNGETPLSIAVKLQDTQLIQALLQLGANIDETFAYSQTVLHQAAYDKNPKICQFLLENGANPNKMQNWSYFFATGTPLHIAASKNSTDLVELFIKYHANVNLRNEWGETPLHVAAYYGANESLIDALVMAGASVNKTNGLNSWTAPGSPLHIAAQRGHLNSIKALLKNGAEINLLNEKDETAVMMAVKNDQIAVLKLLLEHSPNLRLVNEGGQTVLDMASKSSREKEMLELLLKA